MLGRISSETRTLCIMKANLANNVRNRKTQWTFHNSDRLNSKPAQLRNSTKRSLSLFVGKMEGLHFPVHFEGFSYKNRFEKRSTVDVPGQVWLPEHVQWKCIWCQQVNTGGGLIRGSADRFDKCNKRLQLQLIGLQCHGHETKRKCIQSEETESEPWCASSSRHPPQIFRPPGFAQ